MPQHLNSRSTRALTAQSLPGGQDLHGCCTDPPDRQVTSRQSLRLGRVQISAGLVAVLLIAAVWAAALVPLVPVGIDNLDIAAIFSSDEALSGRIVRTMIDDRTLSPSHFFAYGALYHELAALVLAPVALAGAGDAATLIALRSVSLVAGATTIILVYCLAARLYSRSAGILSVALILPSVALVRWSVTAHPDTLQLALISACLIGVIAIRGKPTRGRVALAGMLAGLVFGTKYGGGLLLPIIWLSVTAAMAAGGATGRRLLRSVAIAAAISTGAFVLAFVFTNPYALIEWRRFITQVQAELEHVRTGHVFVSEAGPLQWLRIIASPAVAGLAVCLVAAGGVLVSALSRWPVGQPWRVMDLRRLGEHVGPVALIAVWTCGYLAYLLLFVRLQEPRYALPVLPGIAVLAAGAVAMLGRYRPGLAIGAAALLIALTVAPAWRPLTDVYAKRLDQRADPSNPRIAVGLWLAENVAPASSVLADAYVYIPSEFTERLISFGLTVEQADAARPVAIIVNDDIRDRYRDAGMAASFTGGASEFQRHAETYASLESGRFGCYRLVQQFRRVRVYADEQALATGRTHGCGAAIAN